MEAVDDPDWEPFNVFRDGRVHVLSRMCDTCIFRPGNLMHLEDGRVEEMVAEAQRDESAIVCHKTLGTSENAACHGFFRRHASGPMQIADRLGFITYVDPPDTP